MKKDNKKQDLTEEENLLFEQVMPEDLNEIRTLGIQRRHFIKLITLTGGGFLAFQLLDKHQLFAQSSTVVINSSNAASI